MFLSKLSTAVHILLYIEEYEQEENIISKVLADTTGVNAVNIRQTLGELKKAKLVSVKSEEITSKMIFHAVEESDHTLFKIHEYPNVNCPVGSSIKDVFDKRLEKSSGYVSDLEAFKLSDLYLDMKEKLTKE